MPKSCTRSQSSCPRRRTSTRSSPSTSALSAWPPASSPRRRTPPRRSAPTWTSTAASPTACWTSPPSSTRPSSPLRELPAGAPIAWRKSSTTAKSSARPIWLWARRGSISKWKTGSKRSENRVRCWTLVGTAAHFCCVGAIDFMFSPHYQFFPNAADGLGWR